MSNLRTFYTGKNKKAVLLAAGAVCVAAALLSICLGAAGLSPSELWQAVTTGGDGAAARIFWYVRLPRTLACLLSGAALAASGAIIQGVLANPLAAPNIIGVNAGAGLAVAVCCAAGVAGWAMAGFAFAGALVTVLLVVLIAQKTGASRLTVVLGGVAVSAFLNASTEAVVSLFPDAAIGSVDFRVGGFSAVSQAHLLPAGVLILAGLLLAFSLSNELDVMALGEETASGLGMRVRRMRALLLGLAALLAGASVSFAGLLGFVGLIVPHMARRFVGDEHGRLLPLCALLGAALVTLCDLAARLVFAPYELPAGVLLAFIGGPFFIVLLLRQRGGRIHD